MSEILHEGKAYILKSQVEGIIKERISKIASKASEAERRASELEASLSEVSSRTASLDMLTQQLEELQGKLSASETRFSRYQAVSKFGITEPDIIEAIEYSFEKAMKSTSERDRVTLDQWISQHLEKPSEAPVLLRPHLLQVASAKEPQQENTAPQQESTEPPQAAAAPVVSHNTNTVKAPENQNIIQQGLKDPKFYRENRKAIREAWSTRRR